MARRGHDMTESGFHTWHSTALTRSRCRPMPYVLRKLLYCGRTSEIEKNKAQKLLWLYYFPLKSDETHTTHCVFVISHRLLYIDTEGVPIKIKLLGIY